MQLDLAQELLDARGGRIGLRGLYGGQASRCWRHCAALQAA
ncbi:hypothetical protein [Ottowia sp.]